MDKPSVLVIGAGIGGIATAARLARYGYQVTVVEKNEIPGGRCGQMLKDGHRFDIGATIYFLPSIYEQVFGKMGLDVKECFEFLPLENLYRLFFDDNSTLDFTHDEEKLNSQLEELEVGNQPKIMKITAALPQGKY